MRLLEKGYNEYQMEVMFGMLSTVHPVHLALRPGMSFTGMLLLSHAQICRIFQFLNRSIHNNRLVKVCVSRWNRSIENLGEMSWGNVVYFVASLVMFKKLKGDVQHAQELAVIY